jgi:site-specific DNA-methyltransferase (adenine-specific)
VRKPPAAIAKYFRSYYADIEEGYDAADNSRRSYEVGIGEMRKRVESFRREVIGGATLWLGDCREVLPLLSPQSVDLLWTDPPYGHSNHDGDWNARLNKHRGLEQQPIANDDANGMREVVDAMLLEAVKLLKQDCCCCCCCCGGGGPKPTFAWVADRMDRDGLSFFHSVIWDKKNPGLGWRYRRQHEMVMVSHRKGGKLAWADEDVTARNIFSMMPPRERDHPNEKPLEMVMHFVNLHSKPGQMVLDPFMGSGTTGVAAIKMGRRFVGIELDPEHFETACRRITEAMSQPDMFVPTPEPAPEQLALLEAP